MYWDMTRKMRGHPDLLPGEICHEAVYGLGRGALGLADKAGGTRRVYVNELDAGADGSPGVGSPDVGVAELIGTKTGVAVITSQRFLFIEKKTVVGKPGEIDVELPIGQLVDVAYDRPILVITFLDGSAIRLHVPQSQKPTFFVDAFQGLG